MCYEALLLEIKYDTVSVYTQVIFNKKFFINIFYNINLKSKFAGLTKAISRAEVNFGSLENRRR